MRLAIEHRIACRFAGPRPRLIQLLRLTPANSHDQMVARWRLDVGCDARLREGQDGFGNIVTMLYADGPADGVDIAAMGEVVTSRSDGVLHGVPEALPPALYLRPTAATARDPALAAFAREAAGGREPRDALNALNDALHREAAGPARERARRFVVAARALGAPARYVGGYRLGVAEAHGWAEAFVEGVGWIGFDPSTGLPPTDDYVRVAIGLDPGGAAPVVGLPIEAEVDVRVTREE